MHRRHRHIGSLIDVGVEYGIIEKKGTWFSYQTHRLGQGREAAREELKSNSKISTEIEKAIHDKIAAGDVVRAAQSADKELIKSVAVFDVFSGGALASEGKKSLAIEVTLQPVAETLTDKDIEAVSDKLVAAVKKATGGEIRG